jgi:Cu+-exporting ATPase
MPQQVPQSKASSDLRQPNDRPDAYRVAVVGMSCQHCIAKVDRAIREVPGVTAVRVSLQENLAEVSGGKPHQVIEAVAAAGYESRPLPLIPASCELPSPNSRDTPAEGQARQVAGGYQLVIEDMTCASCVATVERAIRAVPGVTDAAVNLVEKRAQVSGGEPRAVVAAVIDQGYQARLLETPALPGSLLLSIAGEGAAALPELVQRLDRQAEVKAEAEHWRVSGSLHPADLLLELRQAGLQARIVEEFIDPRQEQAEEARAEIRRSWRRAVLAGVVGMGLMAAHFGALLPELQAPGGQRVWFAIGLLCLIVIGYSGRNYYRGAWKQAKHGAANMDSLVAMGTGAAWLSSMLLVLWPDFTSQAGANLYFDASVMILAFLQFGHALEIRAKRTTGEAIGALLGLAPKTARVQRRGQEVELPVSLLRVGDRIRVRPGERIPIDGEVVDGISSVDESMLSGESAPVKKQPGEGVTGGSMNQNGSLLVEVTRVGEETTLAQIVRMVKQAQMSKPPIGRLVDRVSAIFVPVVILIALLSFGGWLLFGPEPRLAFALTAGIAVLVIACPCALGLATPIAIMVGTGRAAQLNILIRNSDALQSASRLTHLVMDKTGTLTQGRPMVTRTLPVAGVSENELIRLAASLEALSTHPLALAVVRRAEQENLELAPVVEFQNVEGRGVRGLIEGRRVLLGSRLYLLGQGIALPDELLAEADVEAGMAATPIWLACDGHVMGLLILKDPLRRDTPSAIARLHRLGIKLVMCTGDNQSTANSVAAELGIDEVHSEVLPADKLEVISLLQQQGHRVGMVGDGINDAPALAQADTGFAIGSGTDVAISHADITLAGDSLVNVSTAIAISNASLRNIKQNLFGAFIYNVLGIPLAAGALYPFTGWLLPPMFASAAMAMSSVTVVSNANRLRFFTPPTDEEESMSVKLNVSGMTCPHCVKNVTQALQAVDGVDKVEVSLEQANAVVTGSADVEQLIAAVKQAGYEAAQA